MGNAERRADPRDKGRLGGASIAQAVIDRGRFYPVRKSSGGEQQKRQAVGTAGDGDPQPFIFRCKRADIGAEPLD